MKDTYYINLTHEERREVVTSLIALKNSLVEQGKFTDGVDEVLYKLLNAKTKKFKVVNIG